MLRHATMSTASRKHPLIRCVGSVTVPLVIMYWEVTVWCVLRKEMASPLKPASINSICCQDVVDLFILLYEKSTTSWRTAIHDLSRNHVAMLRHKLFISARQHICYSALYANARPSPCPSVPLSVTRVDQSKTVKVRITQLSPQSSPMTLVSSRGMAPWNSNGKIGSGGAE